MEAVFIPATHRDQPEHQTSCTMITTQVLLLVASLHVLSASCSYESQYHGPLANPTVLKSGYLADTHEVAAAKGAHLAALAKEGHIYTGERVYDHESYGDHGAHGDLRYHGPTAIPHVLHDGHIADTPEVAAAKAEHFATVSKASTHSGYGSNYNHGHGQESHGAHGDIRYHGPIAIPHVLHDGHIADTPEVSAAKAEHFAALSKATAHGGYEQSYHGKH